MTPEEKERIFEERTAFIRSRVSFNGEQEKKMPLQAANFTRYNLVELFRDLGFKAGAEVGVARGLFSEHLCKTIPDLKLTCVDPWMRYDGNPRARENTQQEECYQETRKRLEGYNVTVLRTFSVDALKRVEAKSLDFVYIDGNHGFDFVMEDLIGWSKKLKYGGIMAGDDYYEFRWSGVIPAVKAYTEAHQVKEWYLTSDVNVKSKHRGVSPEPSFFWIKIS